jgi:hypothetical protein
MKTKFFKIILVAGLLGFCSSLFSQKISYEILLKGEIEYIEEILPFITEKTCLQVVEYKDNFTLIVKDDPLVISSEYPEIMIPRLCLDEWIEI